MHDAWSGKRTLRQALSYRRTGLLYARRACGAGIRQREILRCGKCPPAVQIGADGAERRPMKAADRECAVEE